MSLPPAFDAKESAILIAMYESPNGTYNTYTLARKLNPGEKYGTEAAGTGFEETRSATEALIVKGLIAGVRMTSADGVYFQKLKLTAKGEQTAIQVRSSARQFEKSLPEFAKRADEVAEEMRKAEKK